MTKSVHSSRTYFKLFNDRVFACFLGVGGCPFFILTVLVNSLFESSLNTAIHVNFCPLPQSFLTAGATITEVRNKRSTLDFQNQRQKKKRI